MSLEYCTFSDPWSRIHSTDEGIIQSIMIGETPSEDYHHRSHLQDNNEYYSRELNHPLVFDFFIKYYKYSTF